MHSLSKITKNHSQGVIFVTMSYQRVRLAWLALEQETRVIDNLRILEAGKKHEVTLILS